MSNIRGLGTCVIIHGKGDDDFQAVINGVVSQEWKRAQARDLAIKEQKQKELEDAMEWMRFMKQQRDRQRERKPIVVIEEKQIPVREKPRESMREKIGFVLACLLCWGEVLKLWEYVGDEEEWK